MDTNKVGNRVSVVCDGIRSEGTLRYIGKTRPAKRKANSDGSVDGVRYFHCASSASVFVRESAISLVVRKHGNGNLLTQTDQTSVEIQLDMTQIQQPHVTQIPTANSIYQHEYPLYITVEPYLDDDSQQKIEMEKKSTVQDLIQKISKEFSMAEANLKLFHYPTGQIEKRRVLSEAANLHNVLSKVKMPSADITFDFAHNVHIVCRLRSRVGNVHEEIQSKFDSLRGYEFEIMYERASGVFSLTDDEQVKEICLKAFKIHVKKKPTLSMLPISSLLATTSTTAQQIFQSNSSGSPSITPHQFISAKEFDVMILYLWKTKTQVDDLQKALTIEFPDLKVWIDTNEMRTDIYDGMAEAITESSAVIACLSKPYLDLKKPIIPVHFFENSNQAEAIRNDSNTAVPFLITAGALYARFNELAPSSPK
ncbi:hypothetical protein HK100_009114 [Physocladia obscura]|uniref:CAP-Gly domain-containing protein n=1 Tax=Physocladia obscura TaxID=109957 RepID=A0AAD5SMN6_9FUNG|nr:hypothetical protein HK100_009114 [Physocladia obscura]